MSDPPHYPLFVDGTGLDTKERYEIRNPANNAIVATVAKGGIGDADSAVAAARRSFEQGVWASRSPQERAEVLRALTARLAAEAAHLAELESAANGATARQAGGLHIGMAIPHFGAFAEQAASYVFEEPVEAPGGLTPSDNVLRRVPVGVVGAIIAWNFPLLLAVWKVGPALAAGCSIVIKVDERAPLTVLKFAELAYEEGVPAGVLNVITGDGAEVGSRLTSHPDVAKIAFTGSTAIGREIMRNASAGVKNVSLELGGKAPMIALEDADLDTVADGSLFASMLYSGQICASGTRLFVPAGREAEIVERLTQRAATLKVGDPADPATDVGPVISERQRDRILAYIEGAVADGATVVAGGGRPEGEGFEAGWWVEPTVLAGVSNDMTVAREEIFGPVLVVIPYASEDEAIELANDSDYGLTAGVWGSDREHAEAVARRLRAGTVWVNDWHLLHPALPFGGFKQSGVGRELGQGAIDDYVELQHIHVGLGETVEEHIFGVLLSTAPQSAPVA